MKAAISKETRKENRKINHSLIEKKRRNKMNECLNQLNQLVPSCAGVENMHKLDVLEQTVAYIMQIQNKTPPLHLAPPVDLPLTPTKATNAAAALISSFQYNVHPSSASSGLLAMSHGGSGFPSPKAENGHESDHDTASKKMAIANLLSF